MHTALTHTHRHTHTQTHAQTHTHVRVSTRSRMHPRPHKQTCTHKHTHTHTHTHKTRNTHAHTRSHTRTTDTIIKTQQQRPHLTTWTAASYTGAFFGCAFRNVEHRNLDAATKGITHASGTWPRIHVLDAHRLPHYQP